MSRNLLFAHLNNMNHFSSKDTKAPIDVMIIQSKANPASVGSGYVFRDFNYCEIRYFFNLKGHPNWGCLDTGGGMSLIGGPQMEKLPWTKRVRLKEPIKVKGKLVLPLRMTPRKKIAHHVVRCALPKMAHSSSRILGADRNGFGYDEGMIHGYDLGCILAWFLFIFASCWDRWGQRFFRFRHCHVVSTMRAIAIS